MRYSKRLDNHYFQIKSPKAVKTLKVLNKMKLNALIFVFWGGLSSFIYEQNDSENLSRDLFNYKVSELNFSEWLSNKLCNKKIPFSTNLTETDRMQSNIIYIDTTYHNIDVSAEFSISSKGKISNLIVEVPLETSLIPEIEHIITKSHLKKIVKKDKHKINSKQKFIAPLALKGKVAILDKGPEWGEMDKRVYSKRYNLTRYLHQVAMHIYNKANNRVEMLEYADATLFHIQGILMLNFNIDNTGKFSNLKYIHNLSGIQLGYFIEEQTFPGHFFSTEVKWTPAILNGEAIGVSVKAIIDFDKKELSWDCYLENGKK